MARSSASRARDAQALVAALADEDVVVSSREANLRVALHLYNTREDLDKLLSALRRHRHLLAGRSSG